jgi:hypothetical protein
MLLGADRWNKARNRQTHSRRNGADRQTRLPDEKYRFGLHTNYRRKLSDSHQDPLRRDDFISHIDKN